MLPRIKLRRQFPGSACDGASGPFDSRFPLLSWHLSSFRRVVCDEGGQCKREAEGVRASRSRRRGVLASACVARSRIPGPISSRSKPYRNGRGTNFKKVKTHRNGSGTNLKKVETLPKWARDQFQEGQNPTEIGPGPISGRSKPYRNWSATNFRKVKTLPKWVWDKFQEDKSPSAVAPYFPYVTRQIFSPPSSEMSRDPSARTRRPTGRPHTVRLVSSGIQPATKSSYPPVGFPFLNGMLMTL